MEHTFLCPLDVRGEKKMIKRLRSGAFYYARTIGIYSAISADNIP